MNSDSGPDSDSDDDREGSTVTVGTASAAPGECDDGWFAATGLPTGGEERLPVTVVDGAADGPALWVTGGVHGDEATGVAVARDVARAARGLASDLRGVLVVVHAVNPAGLRRNERTSYYGGDDPNRHFPDTERGSSRPPETQERIDRALFDAFADDADLLIDCHTAGIGSAPFAIRDRVLYGERRDEAAAEALAADLDRLVGAFGLPEVREYPPAEYVDQSLQRSVAGAALNTAGVPAITAELGGHSVVSDPARAAGVAGVFGVCVEFGLLDADAVPDGVGEPGAGVPAAPVDYPVRRFVGPRTERAGLARHRVEAGDVVTDGDPVADVVSPHGETLATVESDHDGYVLGRAEGLAVYEGTAVARMAVRDDGDLIAPREGEGERDE